jgi:pre-mRNA-processing factor 19
LEVIDLFRKKREISSDLASKENIANWEPKSSHTPHLSSSPGILCVDIHPDQNQLVSGGVDKTVKVFNRELGKVTANLTGHSKRVNSTHFLPSHNDSILTTSADKTVRLWARSDDAYSCAATLKHHSGDVVGATVLASGNYAVSVSTDGSWAFMDVAQATVLRHVQDSSVGAYSSVNFHPDGLILGTGTADHVIRIWDMTSASQQNVATCEGHTGAVNSVVFSENGYYMASASVDGSVKLWDLRKLNNFRNIDMGGPVYGLDFDSSGSYLVASGQDIRVFSTKSWDGIATLASHTGDVTSVRFGQNASFLVSTSMDRSMKFYF